MTFAILKKGISDQNMVVSDQNMVVSGLFFDWEVLIACLLSSVFTMMTITRWTKYILLQYLTVPELPDALDMFV